MTPENASLLASLPESIDVPSCVSRLVMDVKELPGIKFFGVEDWYPEVAGEEDISQEPSATVKKIRDAVDAPESRIFPVTPDEFAEVMRFHIESKNIWGLRSIEIVPPGREKQDGEIRFIIRGRTGAEYGKILAPSKLKEIFGKVAYKALFKISGKWSDSPEFFVADDDEDAKRKAFEIRTDDTTRVTLFDPLGNPIFYREKQPDGAFSDWEKL